MDPTFLEDPQVNDLSVENDQKLHEGLEVDATEVINEDAHSGVIEDS